MAPTTMTRFLGLSALLLLCACSSGSNDQQPQPDASDGGDDVGEPEDVGPPAPSDWDRPVTPPADDVATAQRAGCGYVAGALPAETQGASHPMGKDIPVDHIVVFMQENRSFDHYFWKLKDHGHPDVEVAPADFTNPGVDGKPVAPFRDQQFCFVDTAHGWDAVHTEYDDGKMDGFVKANDGSDPPPPHGDASMTSGVRAMAYYEPEDLPFMYWAADNFAIGDHYHCSVLGPTWPNREYLYAASSFGRTSNKIPNLPTGRLTIFDMLQMRRVSWKIYRVNTPASAMFVSQILAYQDFHVASMDQFYEDAKNGALPQVAFLDGKVGPSSGFDPDEDDEHPPSPMFNGQATLAKVAEALVDSPQWSSTAYFITYDEHGGIWDHVPPPPACEPDSIAPILDPGETPGKFDRYGIRVPFVVISPFAKKGFAGHHTYDHTSITRFIEARFTLPAMSARDANAEAPWEMFDFAAPRSDKPAVPDVPRDPTALSKCAGIFNP
jgi:phospholipase C